MRRTALFLIATFAAFLFPAVYGPLANQTSIARATPSLSGAVAVWPPNATFSGVGAGPVGTPPTNSDFETAGSTVGTPPTNNDFSSGSFSGWTTTGSPTIQSGGPGGNYAQLGSGQKIQSSAFGIDSTAQTLTFNVASNAASAYSFKLHIWSGGSYATDTSKTFSCSSSCTTSWISYSLDAVPWEGQSIKISIERVTNTINADDAAVQSVTLSGWAPAAGDKATVQTGGPTGSFAQTSTTLTSAAFAVNSSAQNGSVDLQVSSASGSYSVKVLSGGSFATSTTVFSGTQANSSTWGTKTFGLGSFAGQTIKLQVVPATGATVQVDQAGIATNTLPGWSSSGTGALSVATDAVTGMSYISGAADTTSSGFYLDGTGYKGNLRGNWFKITYKMTYNYNPQNTDTGSTVNVWIPGDVSPWFIAAGKQSGSPYDPTDTWIEKYFFVYNPSSPYAVSPRTAAFDIKLWPIPPLGNCGTLGCEGSPAVASIVPVDGPGQSKVLGTPAAAGGIPPNLCQAAAMCTLTGAEGPGLSAASSDPVEVTSGNYTQIHTDLAIPGRGIPLSFTRTYSAQAPAGGPNASTAVLGAKWSFNWQASLSEVSASTAVVITLPGGASQTWSYYSGAWHPPAGIEGTLVKNGGGDWTLTTGGQLVYAFNSSGQWTSVTDRNGNTTTLTYSSGKLTTITDPGGRGLTLTYGVSGTGNGRITSVSDGTRSASYGYDSNGDLTTITDVLGGTIAYQYSGHLLTQGTDAKSHVFVRNTYDASGRVTQQLDVDGGTTTLAYDTPGAGATRITDQRSKTTTYYFDQQMRITDVVDNDGNVTSTAWDSNNNPTSKTNALGKVWTYTYDSHHNVLTATDPLSKVWTYTYNGNNDVLTVTDPLSKITTYAYTSGNLTSVTDANSKVTSFTVDAHGQVTQVTDPLSHSTSLAYDTYGNRTTVTNALSKVWTYAYDGFGRVTSVTDPLSHVTSYTYDAANDVLTSTDPLSHVTTYTYDANGNALTVADATSKVTTYTYTTKDQVLTVTDPASGVMTYGYDAVGNLTTKQDPRLKTTTYAYDNLSRLYTETDPLSNVRTYGYDAASRLTSRQDAKSQTTTYTYNDGNELTNITYPDTTYVSYAYNDTGAQTQMVDGTGTTSYSYDSLYRLTGVTFPGSRTVSYGYDDASRRTSITYPGGSNQVTYAYDNVNRLSTVTDWNSKQTSYAYDDANRMTTATLPNGVVGTSTFDNANRLTGISWAKSGTTLASASYTVDAVGNRSDRTDLAGTQTYSYDNDYRLTSVVYPGPTTTSYTYDAFGNRATMVDGSGTTNYSYDDAGRLTTVTPPSPASAISYTWDNNGDLTARGSDSFGWDFEDRMTSATVSGTSYTYAYRGDGLRNSATTGGVTKTFTWDINAGLPQILDDGSQYVYGAGLISQIAGGSTYYYLTDGLGSVMKTTDSAGAVVNAYTYDVYGKTTASSGGQASDRQFAGQQTDPTGLQYLRARYYDPATGSFLTRDPMSIAPTWPANSFGYAAASPASSADPTGLVCVFGTCFDHDGASLGGHEAGEGVRNVGNAGTGAAGAIGQGLSAIAKCFVSPKCSKSVAANLDAIAAVLDTTAALAVDATTLLGCAAAGPVGCLLVYGAATIAVQIVLLPGNIIGVVATVTGCVGSLAGPEKDGGGMTKKNILDCGASSLITAGGIVVPDANVNALLANLSVCRDINKCGP